MSLGCSDAALRPLRLARCSFIKPLRKEEVGLTRGVDPVESLVPIIITVYICQAEFIGTLRNR